MLVLSSDQHCGSLTSGDDQNATRSVYVRPGDEEDRELSDTNDRHGENVYGIVMRPSHMRTHGDCLAAQPIPALGDNIQVHLTAPCERNLQAGRATGHSLPAFIEDAPARQPQDSANTNQSLTALTGKDSVWPLRLQTKDVRILKQAKHTRIYAAPESGNPYCLHGSGSSGHLTYVSAAEVRVYCQS